MTPDRERLDDIEQRIAQHRVRYLHAQWRADNHLLPDVDRVEAAAEAAGHEIEVDRLLGEWDRVHTGRRAAPL